MTVATLNPFDLLNEDSVPKTSNVKKTVPAPTSKPVVASTAATTTTTTTSAKVVSTGSKAPSSKNKVAEINANVSEKIPLRRNNNTRRSTNPASNGNERQERRRTDRQSRTGYKQDGEKRLTSGKGSWGKAVEQGEEHVTVDESVSIAEAVEISEETSVEPAAAVAEAVASHLTLAQYQATLKKPVVATNSTRKVSTTLSKDQIVKKEAEVFVFPEIVKKSGAKKTNSVKKSESAAGIDVTKYISVRAVSSVEPRTERPERTERTGRPSQNNDNRRNNNNKRESYTPKPAKMDLNDDRSFPAFGSK